MCLGVHLLHLVNLCLQVGNGQVVKELLLLLLLLLVHDVVAASTTNMLQLMNINELLQLQKGRQGAAAGGGAAVPGTVKLLHWTAGDGSHRRTRSSVGCHAAECSCRR
jgi:hypothetical protein